jgi:hypothetical protein
MPGKAIPETIRDCLKALKGKKEERRIEREELKTRINEKSTLLSEIIDLIKKEQEIGWVEIRVSGLGAIIVNPSNIKIQFFEIIGSGTIVRESTYSIGQIKEQLENEKSTVSAILIRALEKSADVSFMVVS